MIAIVIVSKRMKMNIDNKDLIMVRDNLESYIKFMQDRPVHLVDISKLLEILRDGKIIK